MGTNAEWLLILFGWSAAAAGLLLVTWALFWDRSRGRRRCPKCWYDMSGLAGLVCPECGSDAREEQRLFRTRRKLTWAGVAMFLVAIGPVGVVVSGLVKGNWRSEVPTVVLFAIAEARGWPVPPPWPGVSVSQELMSRRHDMGTWWRDRVSRGMARWSFRYRPAWPKDVPLALQPGSTFWYGEKTRPMRVSARLQNALNPAEWQLVWQSGGGSNCQVAWWKDEYAVLAPLAMGQDHIDVQLRTDPQRGWASPVVPGVSPDWEGSLNLPIRVVATVDEAIQPVQSEEIERELAASLKITDEGRCGRGVLVSLSGTARQQGIAVALRIELRHAGQLVATAHGWDTGDGLGDLSGGTSNFLFGGFSWEPPEGERDYGLDLPASPDDSWQIIVTGDGALALRDFTATSYWAGSFTVPLKSVPVARRW